MYTNLDQNEPNLQENLFNFDVIQQGTGKAGFVEESTRKQLEFLQDSGVISVACSGQIALAIITARKIDNMNPNSAPSGQSNLIRALREILEALPQAEVLGVDEFEKFTKLIKEEK